MGSFFGSFFGHFLDHFWGPFWTHFGTRSAQEGGKMSPRGPSRAPKSQKAASSKTLKNNLFFKVFGVQRPPKRASRGPRRLPRGTQGAPKPQTKGIQKWNPNLTIFGPISGPFWGPFGAPKLPPNRPKNETLFWSPREPLLGPDQDSPKVSSSQGLGSFLLFLAPLNDH